MASSKKRPLEEEALELILPELATADAIAWSLSRDLEPPSEEDRARRCQKNRYRTNWPRSAGSWSASPHLRAEPGEWGDARLAIP